MKVLALIFGIMFAVTLIVFQSSKIKDTEDISRYKDSISQIKDSLYWSRKQNEVLIECCVGRVIDRNDSVNGTKGITGKINNLK